ncbi:MAG: hypothetical protein ACYCQK_09425 [Acidiferrobacteraceae bacterium]
MRVRDFEGTEDVDAGDVELCALVQAVQDWPEARVRAVLVRLDHMLDGLTGALEVEYYGPEVGLAAGRSVYRMVVRRHHLGASLDSWGLWICTALPHALWRPAWRLAQVGRLRRLEVVRRLPAFFRGYAAAVQDAGKSGTNAGRRVLVLAKRLADAGKCVEETGAP